MNNKSILKHLAPVLMTILLASAGIQSQAVPYASGISNNAGTVSFILNENADNVKVIFDGGGAGNTNDLGAQTKGVHSFALGAHTAWQIRVTKSAAPSWTLISDDLNPLVQFFAPTSLDVNKRPASPYFGRVYVLEHAGTGGVGTTGTGRTISKGIFALNSDLTDALGQGNTGLNGGLDSLTLFTATANRYDPFKIAVGEDGYLYVADAQDPRGAVARVDGNLANGELVLAGVGNTTQPDLHTVVYGLHVRGSLGAGNLTLWGTDGQWQNFTACNSVLNWNLGAGPLPSANLPSVIAQPGYPTTELDSDLDVAPDGNLFVLEYREAADAGAVKVYTSIGTLLWSSLIGGGDVFLTAINLKVSPDNTKLAIIRNDQRTWIVGLTNGPNGRVPDLSTTNLMNTFGSTSTSTSRGRTVNWDAAGNLYVANRSSELLRVWSPGGFTVATTSFNGSQTSFAIENLILPTEVSVTASTPVANEQGPVNGVFTLTRAGDTGGTLTVNYTMGGTATNGADYTMLLGTVTFAAGATTTNIPVVLVNDAVPEFTETAILSIAAGAGYGIGSPGSATVSIFDNETPEVSITLAQTESRLLEGYSESKVGFQLTRRGLLGPAITANLAYPGIAARGADFNGPITAAIGANVVTVTFNITPLEDELFEGSETVNVSVATGTGYNVGAPSTASGTVVDDDYPAGTVLFADNFETDSSANWITNTADGWYDSAADFAFDYSALYVPVMPGGTTTKALRFRLNEQAGASYNAVSASPSGLNLSGDYRLKFKMWNNYNGPMFNGGPGSTMHLTAGVGTTPDHANLATSAASDGIWFAIDGDGGSTTDIGDCNAYIAVDLQGDASGVYAAGTNSPRSTTHSYYASIWGSIPAPAAQLAAYPGQTGTAQAGNMGVAWHTVVITKATNAVTWVIDGIPIATVPADSLPNGNVFVGFQDLFAGAADVPAMCFVLVDNLRVETYVSAPIIITNVKIVGSNVEIYFTGPTTDAPSAFRLQESSVVNSGYADVAATITGSAGSFKAVQARGTSPKFYRIKRL